MGAEKVNIIDDLFSFDADEHLSQSRNYIQGRDEILDLIKYFDLPSDRRFALKTEAYLLQLAYAYNKILSLSNSRTRILAHQVESTHRIVNSLNQRFLIADEVGLGKTVEAGLVIKEFVYRYGYKRILIICPASLLFQWQNEMTSKFNEEFLIMDRSLFRKGLALNQNANPWECYDRLIVSLDFIKNPRFYDLLKSSSWDSVIFDEAHRLRRDSKVSTHAYNAAELISTRCKSLLLLSATPFRGKLEELYYLIALVDKNLLGPFNSFYRDYCMDGSDLTMLKRLLSEVVIRRTKKEVGGFTKRYARTIRFDLNIDERMLYDETTKYVAEEFNRALQTENRAVGFVMTVFQKLLDSSTYALLSALKNRRIKLGLLESAGSSAIARDMRRELEFEDADSIEDVEQISDLSIRKTVGEIREEIKVIDRLVELASSIDETKKGEKLKNLIETLKERGNKKFLIFTQFRTTQDYLRDLLAGHHVVVFNGSMNRDEKEEAIISFKGDAEILIATEAGGEGRNMQFCNIIINYDLPWSPLKIEQRIGRLHRFGQKKDVYIYNFSTRDTVAERVLEVLENKLKLFEESIGTPDVLLGQIEDELKLDSIIMNMATGRKSRKDVESDIEQRVNNARVNYEKLESLTVAGKMDFNYDEYYKITLRERQFSNMRIEQFVSDLRDSDGIAAGLVGEKRKNNLYPVTITSNTGTSSVKMGTFESEIALENESLEFLAFGHPVVESLIRRCRTNEFGGETGIVGLTFDSDFYGMVFNFLVTFVSSSSRQELIPVIIPAHEMDEADVVLAENEYLDFENIIRINQSENKKFFLKKIRDDADRYFSMADSRIRKKIDTRIFDMSVDMDIHIDPEVEKIKSSYDKKILELEEKLDLQRGQMKWFEKDMRGAITRTVNRINEAKRERESLIEKYKKFAGIKSSVRLLSAGAIFGIKR